LYGTIPTPIIMHPNLTILIDNNFLISLLIFERLSDQGGVVGGGVLEAGVESAVTSVTMISPTTSSDSDLHLRIRQLPTIQLSRFSTLFL